MERLLTVGELAEYLQRPKATLYGWRYRGTGPQAIRIGRELRYRESDIESWLDEQATKAGASA